MSLYSSSKKPSEGPKERPVGLYSGTILEAETKKGAKGEYWSFTFKGTHVDGAETKVFFNLFPNSEADYSQEQIVDLFTCLGVWGDGSATIDTIGEVVGLNMAMVLRFEESEYQGKKRKNLKPNLFLNPEYFTAFELSEGVDEPKQYAESMIWVSENPVREVE
jgi:hypothetical protein